MASNKKIPHIGKIPTPEQIAFRQSCLKVGFYMSLSAPMVETLCAIADNCRPDRWWDYVNSNNKSGDASSLIALKKRGLIVDRYGTEEWEAEIRAVTAEDHQWNDLPERHALTSIGKALVQMLIEGGLFIQSDQSIRRRVRRGT